MIGEAPLPAAYRKVVPVQEPSYMQSASPLMEDVRARAETARDLQARLYREIGISAVAAALRCISQPEPGPKPVAAGALPPAPEARTSRAA